MKYIKSIFPLALAIIWTYALHNSWGTLPPLGKLMSPFHGFWVNAEAPESAELSEENLQIPGLEKTVTVVYDEMPSNDFLMNNKMAYDLINKTCK